MPWPTTRGFVNVGIDYDTAEFAVESIRRWWQQSGKRLYPEQTQLLITADGGGSNGARSRLWKREMQRLVTETGLSLTVCHFPPGTSKWNNIEHWLFSYLSINWRAKPLTPLQTSIELISHTTYKEGLTVTAVKDSHFYQTGIKVSDEELASLHIARDAFQMPSRKLCRSGEQESLGAELGACRRMNGRERIRFTVKPAELFPQTMPSEQKPLHKK